MKSFRFVVVLLLLLLRATNAQDLFANLLQGIASIICLIPVLNIVCSNCDSDGGGPCQNEGTCSVSGFGHACSCATGFEGANCQINLDDCVDNPCGDHGDCFDGVNKYTCECEQGFSYTEGTCQDINECFEGLDNCDDQSQACGNTFGSFTCSSCYQNPQCPACPSGHERHPNGNCVDIDECAFPDLNDCVGNATCVDMDGSFMCDCPSGYSGDGRTCLGCEGCEEVKDCADMPCKNGGICVEEKPPRTFTCNCLAGYAGVNCQHIIDLCLTLSPCMNGGTCTNEPGSYACDCMDTGYTGKNCTEEVNECFTDNPCVNGLCINEPEGSYTCFCDTGWTGMNCEDDVNECDKGTDNCDDKPNQVCVNQKPGFRCDCLPGYAKDGSGDCVVNIDCANQNACGPNASCQDTGGSIKCTCVSGYTGDPPDTECSDVNECEDDNDNNCNEVPNQRCINQLGGFTCDCKEGFIRDSLGICVAER